MNKNKEQFNLIFTIVFSFVLGAVIMLAILKWTPVLNDTLGTGNTTIQNKTQVYEKGSLAPSIEKVYDAVMTVNAYKNNTLASTGTAFVYKKDNKYGYLLTNQHVVKGTDTVKLITNKNEEFEAKVLGGDQYLDLAVLQTEAKNIKLIVNLGKSETMKLGDTVFTVGTPLGNDYKGSVTSGILSGKDRLVSVATSKYGNNDWVMKVIQIDASINPGNSGGPLVNVNGEVIGIASLKLVDDEIEGMGFAIPIEIANKHVEELEKGQEIKWPILGIKMTDIAGTNEGYKNKLNKGVLVVEAIKDTSAEIAGIKENDIIIKLNDISVDTVAQLRYELYKNKIGDTIKVTVLREGKEKVFSVKLKK